MSEFAPTKGASGDGRSMPRRKFVVGGAAAALGGAMVSACDAAASTTQDLRRWELPVRHLNALWNDLYPRLAARIWRGNTADDPVAWFSTDPANDWLADWADDFDQNNLGTTGFQARMADLATYLRRDSAVPIAFRDSFVGWDFVLSEEGLDLFPPPEPPSGWKTAVGSAQEAQEAAVRATLYQYYTYRTTGRASVAVPNVGIPINLPVSDLDKMGPGVRIPSPQGPSQVDLCTGGSTSWLGNRGPAPPPIQDFVCTQSRWWQITGAVYRGIMAEYPRVVAHIWHGKGFGDYGARFIDPGDDGLRSIFEERLETHVPMYNTPKSGPKDTGMRFETVPSKPLTPTWEPDRLNITHEGFFFPELPEQPLTFEQMLTEIIEGRAGNPVFTDSSMSA